MAARPLRVAIALLLATAACGPLSHAAVRPDLLDPATGRASPPLPATAPERMRVAVYGDSQGNSAAHQAVVAAILAEKPDLVLFAGDAIDHLPAGHMPDWGGWQYAVPFWPQYVRGYAWVSLLTVVPFPAAVHETLLGAVAPPRKPPDLNVWLEDTAPLRKAGIPVLAAPGNHDEYHLVDQAQFASDLLAAWRARAPSGWVLVRGGPGGLALPGPRHRDRHVRGPGPHARGRAPAHLAGGAALRRRPAGAPLNRPPARPPLLVGQGGTGGALGGAAGREGHPGSAPGGAGALGPHPRLRAHRPPGLRGKAGELRGERRRRREVLPGRREAGGGLGALRGGRPALRPARAGPGRRRRPSTAREGSWGGVAEAPAPLDRVPGTRWSCRRGAATSGRSPSAR